MQITKYRSQRVSTFLYFGICCYSLLYCQVHNYEKLITLFSFYALVSLAWNQCAVCGMCTPKINNYLLIYLLFIPLRLRISVRISGWCTKNQNLIIYHSPNNFTCSESVCRFVYLLICNFSPK